MYGQRGKSSFVQKNQLTEDLPVGGQAVIEGVMMRVPGKIVTAVRREDREIVVREEDYVRWTWPYSSDDPRSAFVQDLEPARQGVVDGLGQRLIAAVHHAA